MIITHEEVALYDRQIRLWGITAQTRIRRSKILMIGLNGLASEIAKTLALAGVDSITIIDDQKPQDPDLTSNIFCRPTSSDINYRTDQIVAKLNDMNPMVQVHIDNTNILDKPPTYFKNFDLVTLHTMMAKTDINRIDLYCRQNQVKFYASFDFGMFGAAFSDLGDSFTFSVEEKQEVPRNSIDTNNSAAPSADAMDSKDDIERPAKRARLVPTEPVYDTISEVVDRSIPFVPFEQVMVVRSDKSGTTGVNQKTSPVFVILHIMMEFHKLYNRLPATDSFDHDVAKLDSIKDKILNHLRLNDSIFDPIADWRDHVFGSLSPVCSIVGGVIGQDMIRTLSGKDAPIYNLFLFDGLNMSGVIEKIGLNKSSQVSSRAQVIEEITL